MKLVLLYSLLPFLFCFQVHGQSCKFIVQDTDPFTGEVRLETKPVILWKNPAGGNSISFKGRRAGQALSLELRYSRRQHEFSVPSGQTLQLKLGDSTTVLGQDRIHVSDFYRSGSTGTVWFVNVIYPLSREHVQALTAADLQLIRIHLRDGYQDFQVKAKWQGRLADLVNCLLNNG